jgi:SAM-dependent methyltransferase
MSFIPKLPFFKTLDLYLIRRYIHKHIINSLPILKGKVLDVGCGQMPYKEMITSDSAQYIGLDIESTEIYDNYKPDLTWDGVSMKIEDGSIDNVLLTEVLEHCPDPSVTIREIHRVLKKNGHVVFSVPYVWYLHESPWDFYRYTPYSLKHLFEKNGFEIVQLSRSGGNDLTFLHSYFIWLKRGSLPKIIRFMIYITTLPLIIISLLLIKQKSYQSFKNGDMYLGLTGVVKKI